MMEKLNDLLKEYPQDINVEDLDRLKVLRWFIKRLVENGKIHREKIPAIIKVDWYLADGSDTEYYNMEESLLMLLSIQDKPIEFLISLLE